MSCPQCGCAVVEAVNVPGLKGDPGNDGADGQNAYTITTADFILPAANANVMVSVASSLWMAVGQNLVISDGTNVGNFLIISFPTANSVIVEWLNYPGDSVTTTTILSGATVSPGGQLFTPTNPLPVAQGGTGAATLTGILLGNGVGAVTTLAWATGTFTANGATPVVVAAASVTANSLVLITLKTVGGTVGAVPAVKTITVATGFTVAATASDTSVYNYAILN